LIVSCGQVQLKGKRIKVKRLSLYKKNERRKKNWAAGAKEFFASKLGIDLLSDIVFEMVQNEAISSLQHSFFYHSSSYALLILALH